MMALNDLVPRDHGVFVLAAVVVAFMQIDGVNTYYIALAGEMAEKPCVLVKTYLHSKSYWSSLACAKSTCNRPQFGASA